MTEGIEAMTTATLTLALDAASLRHQAIASNIANVNTQGYVPQRLNFEAQLDHARNSLQEHGTVDPFVLSSIRLQLEPALEATGLPGKVQLDTEMANLTQNTLQYHALARGLSQHFAMLSTAISDGKK